VCERLREPAPALSHQAARAPEAHERAGVAEPELSRANQALWLHRLDEENDNIRAALSWSIAAGEFELGLRLAGALVRFWSTRGLMGEGRRWLAEALAHSEGVAPGALAKAHFAAGYAALGEGDFTDAQAAFDRSLALAREVGDPMAEGAALAQQAWLAMAAGRLDDASTLGEESIELATAAGDKLTASGAISTLAEVAAAKGDYAEAITLFERGLALRRGLGDKRLIANSLLRLGRAELAREDCDAATAFLDEGLALGRQVKDTWSISVAVTTLGLVQLQANGDPAAARGFLAEGLRLARDRSDKRVTAECVQGLAAAAAGEGRVADAARLFAGAETLREATGAALSPVEQAIQDRFLPRVGAELGDEGLKRERDAGRALTPEEVVALALASKPAAAQTVASPVSPV
jgi:tetratricopeptide (TPR) repeat protein